MLRAAIVSALEGKAEELWSVQLEEGRPSGAPNSSSAPAPPQGPTRTLLRGWTQSNVWQENERKPAQIQTRDGQTEYKKLAHHKDNHGLEQGLKAVQSPALNR